MTNSNNFSVNYTVVPYTGVSTIDFRFRVEKRPSLEKLIADLEHGIYAGELRDLNDIHELDIGPNV